MKKPSVFGKYILLERLNVGGMAEVFLAKAFGVEGFERTLAIKKILPTMAEDDEFITMFIDEARISVQLNHANIVHIHELGKHDESYFIAMEYVPGKDLRSIQERFHRRGELMPTAMAAYIAGKICEGLDYAHRKKDARGQDLGIIHRDVSPQNILLSYDGELKIIDFGIAKAANRSQKTQAGILKGKFGYMSPEQVRGMPIDRRSDIFAVGVILYEMLTGEKLFVGESDFSTLEKVRNAEVPAPKQFNPNIPPGMEKVLLKSLAREPADRYQWGSDLQEDLMRFLVSGESIYSGKQLSSFMKEAFAEDVLREAEKMERFAQVERPDDTISPAPKRKATPQGPSAPVGRRSLSNLPKVPEPTPAELEEMGANRADRTMIVDGSAAKASDVGDSTMIGISLPSAAATTSASPARRAPTRQQLKAAEDADATIAPQSRRNSVVDDSAADLKPLSMTGFSPALEGDGDHPSEDANATIAPQSRGSQARPRIVIGDAPVNGSTTIGPSPLSHTAAEDDESGEHQYASTSESDAYDPEGEAGSDEPEGDLYEDEDQTGRHDDPSEEVSDDEERGVATGRAPALAAAGKRSAAGKGRPKGLLIVLAVLCGFVLLLAIIAAVKLATPGKPRFVIVPEPKVAFTLRVSLASGKGPTRTYTDTTKPIELDPGEYTIEAQPTDDSLGTVQGSIQLKAGASGTIPVPVKFEKHQEPEPAPTPVVDPLPVAELDAGAKVEPALKSYAATFSSSEKDVTVLINGKVIGRTPDAALKDLSFDKQYKGEARKDGFVHYEFELSNPDRKPLVAITLALERVRAPEPAPKAPEKPAVIEKAPESVKVAPEKKPVEVKPAVTPKEPVEKKPTPVVVVAKPTPAKEPEVVVKKDPKPAPASKAMGGLACAAQPAATAEVWVDGKNTGKTTPIIKGKALQLPVGSHKLQLKLNGKLSPATLFEVTADEIAVVKVDVSSM